MNEFFVATDLELEICIPSGQLFRWSHTDGCWAVACGDHIYECRAESGGIRVRSNVGAQEFSRLFALDIDVPSIVAKLGRIDAKVAPFLRFRPGLRVLRQPDLTETLFSFMCSANNHMPRIRSMVESLAKYGQLLIEGRHAFPRVGAIASIDASELRDLGFGYRSEPIVLTAQNLSAETDWEKRIRSMSYQEAHSALCKLPGIGPKVADCVALYALGHGEAVPIDTHVWRVVTGLYFPELLGKKVTPSLYKIVGDFLRNRFGEHAGWLQQSLFLESFSAR